MNYAEITEQELQAKVREIHREGIDAVYLDRGEWNDLNAKLNRIFKDRFVGKVTNDDLKRQPFIQYRGIKFLIVEDNKGREYWRNRKGWMGDALYRAFQDTYEVEIKI